MKRFAVLPFLAAVCLAQTPAAKPKGDACAPPPGAVAPSLPAKLLTGQGKIDFKITTKSAEAQAFFNQGVAQMHSFWAREAERSFLQAAALDPQAAMPQWGIAMVAAGDYRPGFQLDLVGGLNPKAKGRTSKPQGGEARAIAAAKKAFELSTSATEIEKMYIAAVAARRDVDAKDANAGYVRGLRALLAKFPKEVEARNYLALHVMSGFVLPSKKPRAGSMEAVEILRALTSEVPDHPGAHHYVIHGWEGSTFAKEAWPSCKRYGDLANNIPHGLHMPGHIYAQTGKWDEAVKAFGDAAKNEIYWMSQDSLGGNGHHGHNVHFLASSYSFRGDFDKALEAATSLLAYKETPREQAQVDNYRTAYRQGWFAVLRVLVQHEKWDRILDGKTLPAAAHPRQEAWQAWARALAQLSKGDRAAADSETGKFEAALTALAEKTKQPRPEALVVAQTELQAHLSADKAKRIKLLDKAAKLELALRYTEPTSYPRPVLEVLGQEALRQGQPKQAERAFRMALEQYPESAGAKAGLRLATERRAGPVTAGLD